MSSRNFDAREILLIVTATPPESRAARKSLAKVAALKSHLKFVQTGMGVTAVAKSLVQEGDRRNLRGVVVVGLCGSLDPHVNVGTIEIPNQIVGECGPVYEKISFVDEHVVRDVVLRLTQIENDIVNKKKWTFDFGAMITVDRIVQTAHERITLAEKSGAACVDMESFEIARWAKANGVPIFIFKVVSDDLSLDLPDFNSVYQRKRELDASDIHEVLRESPERAQQLQTNMGHSLQILMDIAPKIVESLWQRWGEIKSEDR